MANIEKYYLEMANINLLKGLKSPQICYSALRALLKIHFLVFSFTKTPSNGVQSSFLSQLSVVATGNGHERDHCHRHR